MIEKDKVIGFLNKLKVAHNFYVDEDEFNRGQIMEAFEYIFEVLETAGIDRSFSMLYLIYGNDFLMDEFKYKNMEEFISHLV